MKRPSCFVEPERTARRQASPPVRWLALAGDGSDRHRVSVFLRSIADGGAGPRYMAHLHGRHGDTRNIILAIAPPFLDGSDTLVSLGAFLRE